MQSCVLVLLVDTSGVVSGEGVHEDPATELGSQPAGRSHMVALAWWYRLSPFSVLGFDIHVVVMWVKQLLSGACVTVTCVTQL